MGNVLALVFSAAFVGFNLFAVAQIVMKSGYPRWWIALPIAPAVLTYGYLLVEIVTSFHSISSGKFFHINPLTAGSLTEKLLTALDIVLIIATYVFFLVFAFGRWPVLGGARVPEVVTSSAPAPVAKAAARTPGVPRPAMTTLGASRTPAPAAPVMAGGGVDTRKRVFCGWCAERIPGNRALGHDCGPKDRPETICRFCGQELPEPGGACPTCDA